MIGNLREVVYQKIIANQTVIDDVGIENVHYQSNDESANDYTIASPMITFVHINTSNNSMMRASMFQVTVRSKDILVASEVATDISDDFDRHKETDYKFSWIAWMQEIYDFDEKMHWVALTLMITKRKY